VIIYLLHWVHLPTTNVFTSDRPRLVLESDAIVIAFGYDVGIPFTCGVKEIKLLAPIALPLRLGAVVASRFGLIALQMALSTGQAASARALWLPLGRGIALSLLSRDRPCPR
jgi:hypothetical protein